MAKRQPRHEAQSVVEFALVLPLFLLLLFALLDFSRLLFTYVSMTNGAREMARIASVSTNWSSNSAVAAFQNYTIVAGGQNGSTDSVTVVAGPPACARIQDTGGTCPSTGPSAATSVTCTLPLLTTTCTLPQPEQGGFVQIQLTYQFQFNPLFQTRLDGIIDTSFMRPTAQVVTSSRAYVE
jgi:Flp pilus assembly protein TadG